MADQRLEQLKSKYGSVINLIHQLGTELQNLHVEDNKLFIKGHAKTKADSNRIWNQIKLVDGNFQQDLMAQFTFAQDAPAMPAAAAPQAQPLRTYKVKPGDTLSKIAKEVYGDASKYMKIFEANRDKMNDPNKIFPGQELSIP